MKDEICKSFIPDSWFKPGASISRRYLITILASVAPDFMRQVVEHANAQRMVTINDDGQQLDLEVCQEMKELLANIPYIPSKFIIQLLIQILKQKNEAE